MGRYINSILWASNLPSGYGKWSLVKSDILVYKMKVHTLNIYSGLVGNPKTLRHLFVNYKITTSNLNLL
jgi:hypothetical protein